MLSSFYPKSEKSCLKRCHINMADFWTGFGHATADSWYTIFDTFSKKTFKQSAEIAKFPYLVSQRKMKT